MPQLPKHLRPRWRYLGVGIETWPDAAFDRGAFQRHVWYAGGNLLGDVGSARADLTVLGFAFDPPEGETVVRARRGHVGAARAALACLEEVAGHPVGLHVRGASGTVRACEEKFCPALAGGSDEEKYIRRRREPPQERTVVFEGAERSAIVRADRADVRVGGAYAGATNLDLE